MVIELSGVQFGRKSKPPSKPPSKPLSSPSKPLFEQSKILPIKYRVMYRVVCLVYKSLNNLTPDYLSNMFKPLSTISQRHTRSTANMDLWIPNHKLTITRSGLRFTGAYFYNMLPPDRLDLPAHFKHSSVKPMNCFWICIKITRKMYSVC